MLVGGGELVFGRDIVDQSGVPLKCIDALIVNERKYLQKAWDFE
jgi:hypothetical protein